MLDNLKRINSNLKNDNKISFTENKYDLFDKTLQYAYYISLKKDNSRNKFINRKNK